MVTISMLDLEMKSLDRLRCDTLAISIFSDERPLRGLAGLLDWRSCGRMSKLIQSGWFSGQADEVLLFPPWNRISCPRALLFGLGSMDQFDNRRFRLAANNVARTVTKLRSTDIGLSLPGLHRYPMEPELAIEIWAKAAGAEFQSQTLLTPLETQKQMSDELKRCRSDYQFLNQVSTIKKSDQSWRKT